MTTSSGWTQWDTDFNGPNGFINGALAHTGAVTTYNTDKGLYQTKDAEYEARIKAMTDPMEEIVLLLNSLATSTNQSDHANILGLYDDQLNGVGKSMAVNARNSQLANDIQNLTNDSVSTSDVPIDQQVTVATNILNDVISAFQSNPDVIGSFDPSVIGSIVTQLKAIQTDITTYFGSGTGQFASFDAMKQALNNKTPGNAALAAKGFADAGQVLTSEGQNINAATNQTVSQITGIDQNWQSFFGSLMKSIIDLGTAVLQDMNKG